MAKEKLIWNHSVLKFIRDARSTKHSDRIVLDALAIRVDPRKRHSCYLSQPLLVIDTQLDLKTVRDALNRLEAANLITRKKRYNDTDYYWINVALLQRQAAANKAVKDELPKCPFEEPTLEQEQQLDADEAKVIFGDAPAADPTPADVPASNPTPTGEAVATDPSTISAAIQSLKFVGEKLTVKEVDVLSTLLLKSYDDAEILQAIGRFNDYALAQAYKADNPAKYLYKSIANAIQCEKEWSAVKPPPSDPAADATEDEAGDEPEQEMEELTELDTGISVLAPPTADEILEVINSIPEGECRYIYCHDEDMLRAVRDSMHTTVFNADMEDYVIHADVVWDGNDYSFKVARKISIREKTHA